MSIAHPNDALRARWTSGSCRAAGVDICYLRTGGYAPPLLALHGLGGSAASWSTVARALEHDFDVVMIDARGHGGSGSPAQGYGYDDHANDVIAVIEALALDAPVLLGHSMGGLTATMVASRLGRAIAGVVLADPTFIDPDWQREVYESDVKEQHRRLLDAGREAILNDLRLRHPHRPNEMIEIATEARLRTRIDTYDVLIPPNPDYRELVRNLSAPALLVLGERGVVSEQAAQDLQNLNPHLRYEMIADVGHGLPFDRPDELAALIKTFAITAIAPR